VENNREKYRDNGESDFATVFGCLSLVQGATAPGRRYHNSRIAEILPRTNSS
jgi:hypothetical protein